jgi:hypothetical protein
MLHLGRDKMDDKNQEDTNKYEGIVPQSIEAGGNFLQKADKKFVIILSIVFTINFLGYIFLSYIQMK